MLLFSGWCDATWKILMLCCCWRNKSDSCDSVITCMGPVCCRAGDMISNIVWRNTVQARKGCDMESRRQKCQCVIFVTSMPWKVTRWRAKTVLAHQVHVLLRVHYWFWPGPISSPKLVGQLWSNEVVCFTECSVLSMLAWASQSRTCNQLLGWALGVLDLWLSRKDLTFSSWSEAQPRRILPWNQNLNGFRLVV